MGGQFGMVKLFLSCILLLLVCAGPIAGDWCPEQKCSSSEPIVRFPFRLRDRMPDNCGLPGFELSCSDSNRTLLELPPSLKFFVRDIFYQSKELDLYSDYCLSELKKLNLSATHFQFDYSPASYFESHSFFSCPHNASVSFYNISCLDTPDYKVNAYSSDYLVDDEYLVDEPVLSCTKMYEVPSVISNILLNGQFRLRWSTPDCRICKAEGTGRLSHSNSSEFEMRCSSCSSKGSRKSLIIAGEVIGSIILVVVVIIPLYKGYKSYKTEKDSRKWMEQYLEGCRTLTPIRYTYAELKRITDQFKEEIGQGSYGTVYKGKLSNEILVAVKVLKSSEGNGQEFINEVATMGRIHHVNVVRLVGYVADGFRRALVYEYLLNSSLQKYIYPSEDEYQVLGWEKLHDIAVGIAKGIGYLHQGCEQRILHFDIKPHNILLDDGFTPKISDFGMAKLCSKDKTTVSMTEARGTIGYIAPEVYSRNFGNVSYESDVYSFGILLLEMVRGMTKNWSQVDLGGMTCFPEWIYNTLEQGEALEIHFEKEIDLKIARKLAVVGLWCIQWQPTDRPPMNVVVQMLDGHDDTLQMPPNRFTSNATHKMNANKLGKNLNKELEIIPEIEE